MSEGAGLQPDTCGCGPWTTLSGGSPCRIEDDHQANAFLANEAGQRTASANEMISGHREGERRCFRVLDGVVRLVRIFPDGQRQVARFAFPGDFVGLTASERELTCEAVTDTTVLEYDAERLERISDCNPHLARQLARALRDGVDQNVEHVRLLGRRSARQRLALFLKSLHGELGLGDLVPLPMARADIADHVGLTAETVSRAFAELKRRRVLMEIDRNLVRLDLSALTSLADET
ncbi:Crp/Fnr family transcriptional regulator [Enterovirga aerilata]|uniref:Crp/Fnr family transcriptional regulator n=1 Tax=Enterovirga aerilata TaxID=2730920 RepID=A0A849I938_9HYPH|nr:Crp/Fnr family transcriptional regulator [Enterovirga sp. DB1703]NNM73908.1 Crp/Fnr family transcriptional regulator [Enterovirga sp. DB1703]